MTEKSKIGLGTVTWDPDEFEFTTNLRCVTKEDIESQLGRIIEKQWESVHSDGPVRNNEIFFCRFVDSGRHQSLFFHGVHPINTG